MRSLEKCTEILNRSGKKYTTDEIKLIRNTLYELGYLEIDLLSRVMLNGEDGNYIHPRLN